MPATNSHFKTSLSVRRGAGTFEDACYNLFSFFHCFNSPTLMLQKLCNPWKWNALLLLLIISKHHDVGPNRHTRNWTWVLNMLAAVSIRKMMCSLFSIACSITNSRPENGNCCETWDQRMRMWRRRTSGNFTGAQQCVHHHASGAQSFRWSGLPIKHLWHDVMCRTIWQEPRNCPIVHLLTKVMISSGQLRTDGNRDLPHLLLILSLVLLCIDGSLIFCTILYKAW